MGIFKAYQHSRCPLEPADRKNSLRTIIKLVLTGPIHALYQF